MLVLCSAHLPHASCCLLMVLVCPLLLCIVNMGLTVSPKQGRRSEQRGAAEHG